MSVGEMEARSPGFFGELVVLDETGDTKIVWDSDKPEEVENARESFNRMRKKGYAAFAVDKKGEKGKLITEFDASAEKIILSPPIAGG